MMNCIESDHLQPARISLFGQSFTEGRRSTIRLRQSVRNISRLDSDFFTFGNYTSSGSSDGSVFEEIPEDYPVIKLKNIDEFPKTCFRANLLSIYDGGPLNECLKIIERPSHPAKIPNFIALPVYCLREQFENEVQMAFKSVSFCFLDKEPIRNDETLKTAVKIIESQEEWDVCYEVLKGHRSEFIFGCLIDIFSLLEKPMFKLSDKTVEYFLNDNIQPEKQYLFPSATEMIDMVYNKALDYCAKTSFDKNEGNNSHTYISNVSEYLGKYSVKKGGRKRYKYTDLSKLQKFSMQEECIKYYRREPKSRATLLDHANKINFLIHTDLFRQKSKTLKHCIQFIIRNLVNIIRRYVSISIKRFLQKDPNAYARELQARFQTRAVEKLCEHFAHIFIRLPKQYNHEEKLTQLVLGKILTINHDRIWLRQQSKKDIFLGLESTVVCHPGCPCAFAHRKLPSIQPYL